MIFYFFKKLFIYDNPSHEYRFGEIYDSIEVCAFVPWTNQPWVLWERLDYNLNREDKLICRERIEIIH